MKKKGWKERLDALVEKYGSREAVAQKLGVSYWSVVGWINRGITPMPLVQRQIELLEKEK